MKKIFYSLMAVALCSCAQSDVEDEGIPTPVPENKGVRFEVVDKGFIGEDGTRVVTYGDYGEADAYKAKFSVGDRIGLYAINATAENMTENTGWGGFYPKDADAQYIVKNAELVLTESGWELADPTIKFDGANLLFAYAPYRENASHINDHTPTFTKAADGDWGLNTYNNRFFVGGNTYNDVTKCGTPDDFAANDWMGAVVNLTGKETSITLQMQHMRGMIEVTTDVNVELTDLTLKVNGDYAYDYYIYNESQTDRTKNVYRILTTEYRSDNTLYATIVDGNVEMKYSKALQWENGTNNPEGMSRLAGVCRKVNIGYTSLANAPTITVSAEKSLEASLIELYESDYATDPELTTLKLEGTLQGNTATEGDWATLRDLSKLTMLDMSKLKNKSIPQGWLSGSTVNGSLRGLILPQELETINMNALHVTHVANIELPATVQTIGQGVFWCCYNLSVRIPDGSSLKNVGPGAFDSVNAVYTYEGCKSVLVLPESLMEIKSTAFQKISSLKKVVLNSESTTIGNKAFYNENALIIQVPNSTNYKNKNYFPGHTVVVAGPTLTVANYKSLYTFDAENAGYSEGLGLAALCDGITGVSDNLWHSEYLKEITYDKWGVYIDIALPSEYNNLWVSYTTRFGNANAAPTEVQMAVSNDNGTTYAEVGDPYTTELATEPDQTVVLGPITADANYNSVRFAALKSKNGDIANQVCGLYQPCIVLAELTLYNDCWTE